MLFIKKNNGRKNISDSRQTSIRLPESQIKIKEMSNPSKSEWIERALFNFLRWDSYVRPDWDSIAVGSSAGDGDIWLDAVEMGVEYRVRTKLLDSTQIKLTDRACAELNKACSIVERHRPLLKSRGIASGIIRTAIAQQLYQEEV